MKVTLIPVVRGVLDSHQKIATFTGGRVETIQTTTLLRLGRILRTVRETLGDLVSLKPL